MLEAVSVYRPGLPSLQFLRARISMFFYNATPSGDCFLQVTRSDDCSIIENTIVALRSAVLALRANTSRRTRFSSPKLSGDLPGQDPCRIPPFLQATFQQARVRHTSLSSGSGNHPIESRGRPGLPLSSAPVIQPDSS